MASSGPGLPAPARPYSDSDADPRPINTDAGAVPAVIAGIAGIAVIATVIAPPADQRTSGTRTIAAGDRFGQIRLRQRGANSGCCTRRHSLGAADRRKGQRRRDRRRRSGRQNRFSHDIPPSGIRSAQKPAAGAIQLERPWFVPLARNQVWPSSLPLAWLTS